MFFKKDPTEMAILHAFGKDIATLYKSSKHDDLYMKTCLITALKMTKRYPISTPFLQSLIKDELENLTKGKDSENSNVTLALVGAGASAYERWNLSDTPIPTRLKRLTYVPPGWRMDALSGSRFWMASLIGEPAPIRAWLIELYASAAALSWDSAVQLETVLDTPVPALPFAFQALSLNGLVHGIQNSNNDIPDSLKSAAVIALDGFLDGLSNGLWENIIHKSAGPLLAPYYNTLISFWNEKSDHKIEPLEDDCGIDIILTSHTVTATLVISSASLGKHYAEHANAEWEDNLMRNEPLVFSGIFTGFNR